MNDALPPRFFDAVEIAGIPFSQHLLRIRIHQQQMFLYIKGSEEHASAYRVKRNFLISTSRFGIGQQEGSNRTPLGLHCVKEMIGGTWPAGTVFKGREPVGFTWAGMPDAKITTRILWLDGLQPGLNRGGNVDSHARYIYIHGTADQRSLGRPGSCGCIHMADRDLVPLFHQLPPGTLVWIEE